MQRNTKEALAAIIHQVALYARVSKDICATCGKSERLHGAGLGHDFKGQDPEAQLQPLRQMCASPGTRSAYGRRQARPAGFRRRGRLEV